MANQKRASIGDALIFMTKAAAACLVAAFAIVLLWLWGITLSEESRELSRVRAVNKSNEAEILLLKKQVDGCVQLLTSLTSMEAAAPANPYEARLQELLGDACREELQRRLRMAHENGDVTNARAYAVAIRRLSVRSARVDGHAPAWTPPDDPIIGESGPWERYQTPAAEAPEP